MISPRSLTSRCALVLGFLAPCAAPAPAHSAPPVFAIRPLSDEHAFAGSIYKAVLVATGCPKPQVVVDQPSGAVFEDDTLKHLPPGGAGTSFDVRVRAVNADGEAAASWRVTVANPVSLEFDAAADYTANFMEQFGRVPPAQAAGLSALVRGGDLQIAVPATGPGATDNLDSWCGFDRSPRWWSNVKVLGAFEVETRVYFPVPPLDVGNGYHVGLALDRGDQDITILGPIRNQIEYERTCLWDGDHSSFALLPDAVFDEISLKIVVNGKSQTWWARQSDSDPWSFLGSADGARPPLRGVGLAVKTWASQASFTPGFRYFRHRGLPAAPPVIMNPEIDQAFQGGEYSFCVSADSDLPVTLTALSPAGAAVGADRVFRYRLGEGAGDFVAQVRVRTAASDETASWDVAAASPVRHEFDALADFTGSFFDSGNDSSSRKGEIALQASAGRLLLALPGVRGEDFDGWCGFDRTPRWLHVAQVTGSFAVETALSFASRPPILGDGYHAGLAVDRGAQDLAILGAIRNGVEYERTCSKDCENTDTFFPGLWDDPSAKVYLRAESTGAGQLFLARRALSDPWTVIDRVEGKRPRPQGIGIAAKNWGGQGDFTAAFEYFEYGSPGVEITQAPGDGEVRRNDTYRTSIRARGVSPRYSLAAAPPGATIDPATGEIVYAAVDSIGTQLLFEARAACGLIEASAAWTVTVTASLPAVQIDSFFPSEASYLGKTAFEVQGANFTAQTRVVIDGARVTPSASTSTLLRGTLPAHAATAGRISVGVEDPLAGSATLVGALRYLGPLALTQIAPGTMLEGSTPELTVTGAGFTPETAVRIAGGALASPVFVDARTIRGRPPALPAGIHDVAASDRTEGGETVNANTLAAAFTVVPRVRIGSFTPAEASYLGKTAFEVQGANFTAQTRVVIDGVRLTPGAWTASSLRGTLPAHAPVPPGGPALPVGVEDPERGGAALEDALRYVGPLQVSSVAPARIAAGSRPEVAVTGLGFTQDTVIEIGGQALGGKTFVDARTIRGLAPALAAGEYPAAARDADADGTPASALWAEKVVYEAPPPGVPGPTEVEAAIAEGTMRAQWFNPASYASILVFDGAGTLLDSLPGNATWFETTVLGADIETGLAFKLQGTLANQQLADPTDFLAAVSQCYTPPPLNGAAEPGVLELPIFGGHEVAQSLRCQDAAPGGGGGGGGGGVILGDFQPFLKGSDALGVVIPAADPAPNELRAGFELETAADALEVYCHYRKLAVDFGVSLRARLVQVLLDGSEGFRDEITLPNPFLDEPREKHRAVYFRAASDPGVAEPEPQACLKKIPKGQYRLEIYTVGGDPRTAYYEFSNDPRLEPVNIPGVPCPPLPWVEVRDISGLPSLPSITGIDAVPLPSLKGILKTNELPVTLTAKGTWLDAAGTHQIPQEQNPHVEYEWAFKDLEPPRCLVTSGPVLFLLLPDYNCYKIELTVRDKGCGTQDSIQKQIILLPETFPVDSAKYTFQFPSPRPETMIAVGSLTTTPPPGGGSLGKFQNARPLRFRILVVPPATSAAEAFTKPAAKVEDVDLQMAWLGSPLQADFIAIDGCEELGAGPKYFELSLADAGKIPLIASWPSVVPNKVSLDGLYKGQKTGSVGKMRLFHRPPVLETSFWTGKYDPSDDSYRFSIQPSAKPTVDYDIGESQQVDLKLGGAAVTIPKFQNRLASGFTARFMLQGGVWRPEAGAGSASGQVLGSVVAGQSLEAKGETVPGTGGGAFGNGAGVFGDGAGAGLTDLQYRWSADREIFRNELKQKLFESILYTGTIGPVPVTIWASVSLGIKALVTAHAKVTVSPFQALGGGTLVENELRLDSKMELFLPATIRADVLFGVASLAVSLVPSGCFEVATLVGTHDTAPVTDYFMNAFLSVAMKAEACIHLIFKDLCYDAPTLKIIKNKKLLSVGPSGPLQGEPESCGGGGGGGGGVVGGGGGQPVSFAVDLSSRILSTVSPGKKTRLDCWVYPSEFGGSADARCAFTDLDTQNTYEPPQPPSPLDPSLFVKRDPAGVFIDDNTALVAWTESLYQQAPGWPFPPLDENAPDYLTQSAAQQNKVLQQNEIAISIATRQQSLWSFQSKCFISDASSCGQLAGAAQRRADGSAVMGSGKNAGEALVAWVRYEEADVLIEDGTKLLPVPAVDAQGNPITDAEGNNVLMDALVPNFRPRLEKTAIIARRVNAAGAIAPAEKISPPGINIEPALAVSPSGNAAYCVWLHDPGHVELMGSNRGRRLLFSVWGKNIGWSAAQSVLANLGDYDALYPGILEPDIALKDDQNGVLVFDALPAGAAERDTGLGGGNRLVYAVQLVNGQFLSPVLLRGECGIAVYGRWVTVGPPDAPYNVVLEKFKITSPEWVMSIHAHGPPGTESGKGGLLVSVFGELGWTAPKTVFKPGAGTLDNVSTSLGAGSLSVLGFENPCAIPGLCGGGAGGGAGGDGGAGGADGGEGGGVDPLPHLVSAEIRLEPDLSIESCRLSYPNASPGSRVMARVTIKNRGFAGSALDLQDRSAVGLKTVLVGEDGNERELEPLPLPPIEPGGEWTVALDLEAPHEPVRLQVVLDPNPVDGDRSNDRAECFFGAPSPRDFTCGPVPTSDVEPELAALLSWSNPALYDQILVYRDGSMIGALSGGATVFVDRFAAPGRHEYYVRGRIGPSKSARARCEADFTLAAPRFRRGDANSDSRVNISDAVFTFGYLFLGSQSPTCLDALDANDDGKINITDGIFALNFLFLGGPEIPPPGHVGCGQDPTGDVLAACQYGGSCP